MKKFQCLIALIIAFFLFAKPVSADVSTWQQSFSLRLNNQTTSQVDTALNELVESGASYVVLSPGWITSSTTSSNVDRKPGTTPDNLVIYTINKAHSLGLKVMLKPHLDISGGTWRASLNPTDKVKFFQNYTNMIMLYTNIAQQTGTEQLCIGAELVALSTNPDNTAHWKALISKVRAVYTGKLTYSANADSSDKFDELKKLTFWSDLDYAGISFYRAMAVNNTPTLESVLAKWAQYEQDYILPRINVIQKPMLITEIGYRSVNGAGVRPWDYTYDNSVDIEEQKLLYQAFFEFWKDKEYMVGVNFWEWEAGTNVDPKTNKNYTPQNKPAEDVVKQYFGGEIATPIPPTETLVLIKNPNRYTVEKINVGTIFYSDRSYTIKTLPDQLTNQEYLKSKNDDKSISTEDFLKFDLTEKAFVFVAYDYRASSLPNWLTTFTNTNKTITTSDTTFNIYQKEFEAGQISLGGNNAFPATGSNSNYFVIASLNKLTDTVVVPETPTEEPEVVSDSEITGQITVDTPDDGDRMDGEKKLKIFMQGVSLDKYTATYNVDNKGPVNMPNDATMKFKQAKIDFDTWTWNGNGPYTVVITTKDFSGKIIDTATISLYTEN